MGKSLIFVFAVLVATAASSRPVEARSSGDEVASVASCGSDSDCAGFGKCSGGKCGACGSDSDCKGGKCSSNHCGACGSDSDCRGGRCSSGRCSNAL